MKTLYPKGTLCLRCGVDKKTKMKGCNTWGEYWSRHLWNDKPIKVEEIKIKI